MQEIPFFDYSAIYKRYEVEFDRIFKDVCSRGAFILQKDLEEFEKNLSIFLGVDCAFGVADGTNAMVLGLKACEIGEGDEVIIASHTYIATAAAVRLVGAEPVFADIGDDFMFCPESAEKLITRKTKALMPTQLNGRCCDMKKIEAVASKHGLMVFEDSAQGLGAKFQGKKAGTFGKFGTLSFYPAKLLGCFGDGGAIMTNDKSVSDRLALLRDHGRDDEGRVVDWGTNSRLDNLQAAFLNFRLKNYSEDISRRRNIALMYHEAFSGHPFLYLPKEPSQGDHFDVYQNYELAAEHRDELQKWLSENGVKTIVQWGGSPVHHFSKLGYGAEKYNNLPKTDWFFERCLMLPMHMSLSDKDVQYIAAQVLSFYENR
jgi:dTDP-4-amino-4,6-dideoxygalactose transaminase